MLAYKDFNQNTETNHFCFFCSPIYTVKNIKSLKCPYCWWKSYVLLAEILCFIGRNPCVVCGNPVVWYIKVSAKNMIPLFLSSNIVLFCDTCLRQPRPSNSILARDVSSLRRISALCPSHR